MQKEDLGYSFAIGLVVGLFLLPILVNTDLYSKLSAPIVLAVLLRDYRLFLQSVWRLQVLSPKKFRYSGKWPNSPKSES